jgi:NADPH:quinone reductase-like Zn-dependent oxidoreductase
MKAVLLTKHGEPEMLCYGEAPDPSADPGEVVVDMCAASVNAADSKVRMGGGRYALIRFPHILGRDFSGVVSALGAGVTDFAVGDVVFGVTDQGVEGAYAEKISLLGSELDSKLLNPPRVDDWRSHECRRSR